MLLSRAVCIAAGSFALACVVTPAAAQLAQTTPQGETVGGISCDAQEGQRIHIHQHLVIFDHGKQVDIPRNVGQPGARARPRLLAAHAHARWHHPHRGAEGPLVHARGFLSRVGTAARENGRGDRARGKGRFDESVGRRQTVRGRPAHHSAQAAHRHRDHDRTAVRHATALHELGHAVKKRA